METPNSPDRPNAPTTPALNAVPDMPVVKPSRQRAAIIAGVVALVVIVAAFGGVFYLHSRSANASTAQDVLNAAANAALRDAAFRISGQLGTTLSSSSSYSVTFSGSGQLTTSPSRLHYLFTATSTGKSGPIGGTSPLGTSEIIADGNTLYTRTSDSTSSSNSGEWIKTTIRSGQAGNVLNFFYSTAFLDYKQLSDPQLIGDETVDGHQTRHIHVTIPTSTLLQQIPASERQQISLRASEDLWIARDTSYPVRVTQSLTLSESGISFNGVSIGLTGNLTMDFTSWNTGLTIPLPTSYIDESGAQATAVPNS
jgi:hypothetical protein